MRCWALGAVLAACGEDEATERAVPAGGDKAKATLTLDRGRYVFLCSIGGHWNGDGGRMCGTRVVS